MDYLNTVPTVLNAKLLKLADFPQVGKAVTEIDVTGNKISTLPPSLPDTLKSLTITGNFISALPSYLSRLPSLEVLHASTNCIKDADIIFRCPALLHASLAYNSIARLALPTEALAPGGTSSKPGSSSTASRPQRSPSPTKAPTGHPNGMPPPSKPGAVVPISSQLKLVNLSHNDLVDLRGTLRALSCLPCLVSLLLVGNPLVLCEGYRTRTASALPSLEQLDGCKVAERDDASGNAESSGSGGADRGSNDAKVELRISLTGLETPPPPPPQAATGESGDGSKSARKDEKGGKAAASSGAKKDAGKGKDAGAGGKKGAKGHPKEEEAEPMELPPPVSYAVRLLLHKGTEPVTSAEVPPKPLEADEPPKEEGAEPVVEAPLLEHDDVFPVGVPVRNVLRDGFKLILLKTERTPPPPKPEGAPEMDPDPAKDPANWKVATSELGWVVLKFPQLLDGQTREVKRTVAFVRPQPLFNDAKVLLAMDKQHLLSAYDNGQSKAPADSNREPITETSWHAGRVMVTTAVQPWTDD